jgi:hypothetical protein
MVAVFLLLGTYYIAPFLLLSRHVLLQSWVVGLVICCYTVGMFLHFVGDAQKYYTLRFRPGLLDVALAADRLVRRPQNRIGWGMEWFGHNKT